MGNGFHSYVRFPAGRILILKKHTLVRVIPPRDILSTSILHPIWHSFWHSIWHMFWHSISDLLKLWLRLSGLCQSLLLFLQQILSNVLGPGCHSGLEVSTNEFLCAWHCGYTFSPKVFLAKLWARRVACKARHLPWAPPIWRFCQVTCRRWAHRRAQARFSHVSKLPPSSFRPQRVDKQHLLYTTEVSKPEYFLPPQEEQ